MDNIGNNKTVVRKRQIYALLFCILFCFVFIFSGFSFKASAEGQEVYTARPSVNGRLTVSGTQLVDSFGTAVQLRGVSTHGLTWYPGFVSEDMFGQISDDWNCNLVRLAMYSELYCKSDRDREENLRLMRKGIDAAIASDMYVLVDWHILNDYDPNMNIKQAKEFFGLISSEYRDSPNLLFEICNEPNGDTDWADVKTYSEQVIPVIRENMPQAVVVVGTPEYDRNLGDSLLRPLDFDDVMYVLHFYSASHKDDLRGELTAAIDAGLPVFISECGICEASGDGDTDLASAAEWFTYLNEHKIGYAVWSLSNKDETSAFFRQGYTAGKPIKDSDLTVSGKWIRELIRGADPKDIPAPSDLVEKSVWAEIKSRVSVSLGEQGYKAAAQWYLIAAAAAALVFAANIIGALYKHAAKGRFRTYNDINGGNKEEKHILTKIIIRINAVLTLIYLGWRILFSVPVQAGVLAIAANIILLIVEVLGFIESLVLFHNLMGKRSYDLPEVSEEEWPDVDIFVATYNEPVELLRRTINGCVHMKYPKPEKVHIWICDDNRRPQMRELAEEMGVGYFDRPDNKGAKAGNLNCAMARTSAPYIVTFDADMIPKSDFLLKTIPYFVDSVRKNKDKPKEEQIRLGLLQTPQCFYTPDVFQHALYSEKRAPNEQDFFYRSIEPGKTSTNSVIYGGSNTVLSREALEEIGGFYTESITEDFATGMLIESAGFVSLALPVPLASGQTPDTFREHIKQRARWGRGVIVTARKLKIWRRKELNISQKISYWSSVVYWYSPIKNLIYILSPLIFAVFGLPVFRCGWLELLMFWLPMFIMQDICLRVTSKKTISHKWSGIYEMSVMPHLLIPIINESLGITLSTFKVTDKSGKAKGHVSDHRAMIPFFILIALSVAGLVRVLTIFESMQAVGLLILLFWVVWNLYFLLIAVFLVDGRDKDGETVTVKDAVSVKVTDRQTGKVYEGITTYLTEHSFSLYLDNGEELGIGGNVDVELSMGEHRASVAAVVKDVVESRRGKTRTHSMEILDFGDTRYEYWEILYDRIPTLPQSLHRDFGIMAHLWQNIAHRVARTRR